MKLYLVILGDECKKTCTTERAARSAARAIREGYWPAITIIEVDVGRTKVVKRMKAVPQGV